MPWSFAQAITPDTQPAPLVKLTGVLEPDEHPPSSSFLNLRVWFGDESRVFRISNIEPVIPAYHIREQLRKVSPLGLRLVAEHDELAQLESADANKRPITIEGWLRPHAGLLRVKSIEVAREQPQHLDLRSLK